MEINREQVEKAIKTLEGAKVMVANRDFKEFQMAVITAINALSLIRELTEENERLKDDKSYWKKRAESRELEHDKAVKKGMSMPKPIS